MKTTLKVPLVDAGGFDAIAADGVIAWLMECLDRKLLAPEELGVLAPMAVTGKYYLYYGEELLPPR